MAPTPFGAPMRQHFLLDPNYKNLNHGSFGTYPTPIRETLHNFQTQAESSPDEFLRYTQPAALTTARHSLSQLLNCPASDLVFVKNATTGIATILHNLPFADHDVLLYFSTVYGAVENGIFSLLDHLPPGKLQTRKIEYSLFPAPLAPAMLVETFRQTIREVRAQGLTPKIAVLETVVSLPGIRFPVEEIVAVCRAEGVWSCVDAAHGVGMLGLDLGVEFNGETPGRQGEKEEDAAGAAGAGGNSTSYPKLKLHGVDFLTSNCHKWLYTPRSCALLYVNPIHQHLIRTTLPTSWGYIPAENGNHKARPSLMASAGTKTPFETLFEFVATADDTPYLCTPAALQFRTDICGGEEAIYTYLEDLANEAADLVSEGLGTEVLGDLSPEEKENGLKRSLWRRCAMNNVRLPLEVAVAGTGQHANKDGKQVLQPAQVPAVVDWMQRRLVEDYRTFVPVFAHGGWLWVRLSAQVYLEKSDFEWLVPVLKALVGRVKEEFNLA
ncbi:putative aminotransferase family protein (LolT) [Aspergillus saccharolyticus JOP 1030-1]|uniref:PLP-dependent transferase n=1 Tax=Aspergillus saccharolyticus JOP 1030-1 TaxID=1450539 RepID=A0A318ZBV1_9EURO|nr:PLP-dependent transferase [Aspergillus saccharolyticus JOP 1030-1]PYH44876.1 PLP-dependent transferase [Aspergillus saccharolyticus JOP 1030-1]